VRQACPCGGGGTCCHQRRCMPLRRRGVTVVADRESDIYPTRASVPQPGFHLLSRAMHALAKHAPAEVLVHPDGGPNSLGIMSCRRVFPFIVHPNRVATSGEVY